MIGVRVASWARGGVWVASFVLEESWVMGEAKGNNTFVLRESCGRGAARGNDTLVLRSHVKRVQQ